MGLLLGLLVIVGAVLLLPRLRALLDRTNGVRIAPPELTAGEAVAVQAAVPVAASPTDTPASPFEGGNSPYLLEEAEKISRQASAMKFTDTDELDRWMCLEGAKLRIALDFEQIYRAIFASQMEVLGQANRPAGEPVAALRQRYEALQKAVPQVYGSFPYEAWQGFIEKHGLVAQSGEAVYTTDKGRLFIGYLVARRYELHGQHSHL